MDLMAFPLFGLMLATKYNCEFYTTINFNTEYMCLEFFEHILKVNQISSNKMVLLDSKLAQNNTTVHGLNTHIKDCAACLINPVQLEGMLFTTINLKVSAIILYIFFAQPS